MAVRPLSTGVDLAPSAAGRDVQSGRSGLGFLGPWPFRCESPRLWGWKSLDFLGFSRPKSRLFNGLRGIFAERKFLALSPCRREAPRRERAVEAMRKRRIVHGTKLNPISDSLQAIVVGPLPLAASIQKQLALKGSLSGSLVRQGFPSADPPWLSARRALSRQCPYRP